MRFLQLCIILGVCFSMHSQTNIARITGNFENVKQSFNISDSATGNFAIFIEDSSSLFGFLFDPDYKIIGRVIAPDLSSKFESIVGYQINGKEITLLMNTSNGRSYGVVSFNFETGFGTSKELEFKIRGEKFIEAVNYQNTIYLLTIPKLSSQINIYSFNDIENPSLTEVLFEENDFLDRKNRPTRIYDIIYKSEISQVEPNVPNSLEITSREFKIYRDKNIVTLTSDKYSEFTYVVTLDLLTKERVSVKRIEKQTIDGFKMGIRTNSFMQDGKLFQLVANTDALKFQVVDLVSEEIMKAYSLTDEDELFFKNSPITLQGGEFQAYRELKRTNQFLRKISTGDIGISIYKPQNNYQITMGSTAEKENGYVILGGALGGLAGSIIAASINQLSTSYALYKNTKSVKITGLFAEDLTHVSGEIPKNTFDLLKEIIQDEKGITAETLFKIDDAFIWGHYNKKEKAYLLLKF